MRQIYQKHSKSIGKLIVYKFTDGFLGPSVITNKFLSPSIITDRFKVNSFVNPSIMIFYQQIKFHR